MHKSSLLAETYTNS